MSTKEFMSLREFLLLLDPMYPPDRKRSIFRSWVEPEKMVEWYDKAKASWEVYGDAGPFIGDKVEMFQAGHGGREGVVRTFEGEDPEDSRMFCVSRMENGTKKISLVPKQFWFVDMQVFKK